jgi:APA family basic amino acid/polyamine antiporter
VQFVTFLVVFVVMCSGITSASTASLFFAANFNTAFDLDLGQGRNRHRGAAVHGDARDHQPAWRRRKRETQCGTDHHRDHRPIDGDTRRVSAFTGSADVDFSRVVAFETAADKNAFLAVTTATSLAFFALVGFEDSVNMAEETKNRFGCSRRSCCRA